MKEKNLVDGIVSRKHSQYDIYERDQYIIDLDVGDYITITVYDASAKDLTSKTFTAKHGNSHLNCQWQDKGVKKISSMDVRK